MFIHPHLDPDRDAEHLVRLAEATGIAPERLTALGTGDAQPKVSEIGVLAEALHVDPIHLFRRSPVVAARRESPAFAGVCEELLAAVDLHLAAYLDEGALEHNLTGAFPANSTWGARASGEGWAQRASARGYAPDEPDPLICAIETDLHVPVLIWPVARGPFGATVRFGDVFVIWVNSHDVPGTQQRFTLGHETGHLLLRHVEELLIEASTSVDSAVTETLSPDRQTMEQHAQHFAAGVLGDRETVLANWLHEVSLAAVAHLASKLGASFQATLNLLSRHLGREDARDIGRLREVPVYEAFREAGLEDSYHYFMDQAGQRYVSPLFPEGDYLEESLRRTVG